MQFQRIVIGVEFSAASLAAARWAATQLAPRAEIVLAHVLREPTAPSFLQPYLPPLAEFVAERAPVLYGGLRGLADVIGTGRTQVRMLAGQPADALAGLAREVDADLICLGRRRRRRGAARFGHTTAQRLLARTRTPVLVVPATRPAHPARILAAVDDQADRHAMLRTAWGLAQAHEARLDVLHVLGPELRDLVCAPPSADPSWACAEDQAQAALRDEAHLDRLTREWLAEHVAAIGAGGRRTDVHMRVGDPGEEIVKFAYATGVDLIAMGRGGNEIPVGAPAGASLAAEYPAEVYPTAMYPTDVYPLGSTARLVLWASPCPVLVLPPAAQPAITVPPPTRSVRPHARETTARARPLAAVGSASAPRTGHVRRLPTSGRHRPAAPSTPRDAA